MTLGAVTISDGGYRDEGFRKWAIWGLSGRGCLGCLRDHLKLKMTATVYYKITGCSLFITQTSSTYYFCWLVLICLFLTAQSATPEVDIYPPMSAN